MKEFIIGCGIIFCSLIFNLGMGDIRHAQREYERLKFVADEISASAALFYDEEEYSSGKKVFNRVEAEKAVADQLKKMLKLDDSFFPLPGSYWAKQVKYKIYFYDDLNTLYPFLFTDDDTGFTYAIIAPTVIVTINVGRPRYNLSLISNNTTFIRSSASEWQTKGTP